jgi:hypothetical protein
VEEQISNLGGAVEEGVLAAWDEEIKRRVTDFDSGRAKTVPWTEVRQRNLVKVPRAH